MVGSVPVVPILRDDDPRMGCLAVPLSAVGGFVLFVLVAAALGASAGLSVIVAIVGALLGVAIAAAILRR